METAVRLAADIGGVLSLASLAAFLGAGVRLLREPPPAARLTAPTPRRAESTEGSQRTIGDVFLTF